MPKNIALLLFAIIISSTVAEADDTKRITSQLIQEKNRQMASVLGERNPQETIHFLHTHISEEAVFQMSVDNPYLPAGAQGQQLNMNKEDYIKTFIDGLHYVDAYNVSIETSNITISNNGHAALAEQTMTEEGIMLNPYNLSEAGIPFKSQTTCKIYYTIKQGSIQSDKAQCRTQTGQTNDA